MGNYQTIKAKNLNVLVKFKEAPAKPCPNISVLSVRSEYGHVLFQQFCQIYFSVQNGPDTMLTFPQQTISAALAVNRRPAWTNGAEPNERGEMKKRCSPCLVDEVEGK